MTTAVITPALALTLIAQHLPTMDQRRICFSAASEADQTIFIARATADFAAVRTWNGEVDQADQPNAFPRIMAQPRCGPVRGQIDFAYIDPWIDAPAGLLIPNTPENVARAIAIQAAMHAERAAGLDPSRHVHEAARRGLVSHSGGGVSESIDRRAALDPWNRLCQEAADLVERYRTAAFSAV